MRACSTIIGLSLCLTGEVEPIMRATRIKPVPQIRAQIRVIMLGLPRPAPELSRDRGPMHPQTASNLGSSNAQAKQLLDLDPISQRQMSVMCGQGSATLRS